MTVKQTSVLSYNRLVQEKKITSTQQKIFQLVRNEGFLTRRQIALYLDLEINNVCGRVNEMLKINLLSAHHKVKDKKTNRMVEVVELYDGKTQESCIVPKKEEKVFIGADTL